MEKRINLEKLSYCNKNNELSHMRYYFPIMEKKDKEKIKNEIRHNMVVLTGIIELIYGKTIIKTSINEEKPAEIIKGLKYQTKKNPDHETNIYLDLNKCFTNDLDASIKIDVCNNEKFMLNLYQDIINHPEVYIGHKAQQKMNSLDDFLKKNTGKYEKKKLCKMFSFINS
jgi:hypothetical protein